jgi:putative ABC transport system ATP-binding protein
LETRGLSKVYKRGRAEVHALRGIDLVVPRGQFLAIMGRSGSGKSTFLNLVGGLDQPTSGTIRLDGQEVTSLPEAKLTLIRRQKVGFIFQQFNLIPTLTALENVMLPLRYAGLQRGEQRRRAQELLGMVGMAERMSHRPAELSGGEQQRVAIARALANHPTLILADEPTGELDTTTARQIMDLLWELNREVGQTFIIVTHDPQIAGATQRVIYFKDGAIEREERPGA